MTEFYQVLYDTLVFFSLSGDFSWNIADESLPFGDSYRSHLGLTEEVFLKVVIPPTLETWTAYGWVIRA